MTQRRNAGCYYVGDLRAKMKRDARIETLLIIINVALITMIAVMTVVWG